jgi:hypothetical protein
LQETRRPRLSFSALPQHPNLLQSSWPPVIFSSGSTSRLHKVSCSEFATHCCRFCPAEVSVLQQSFFDQGGETTFRWVSRPQTLENIWFRYKTFLREFLSPIDAKQIYGSVPWLSLIAVRCPRLNNLSWCRQVRWHPNSRSGRPLMSPS